MAADPVLYDPDREQAARIVALFSLLIHAWLTNDFRKAAEAREELNAMGVFVRLPRRLRGRKGVASAK